MMKRTLPAAGALLMIGSAQCILAMIVSEALYQGYSIANNVISDLGVGISAMIFNPSIIIFGVLVIIAAYILFQDTGNRIHSVLLFLAGGGAAMVGFFPLYWGIVHYISAGTAFLAGGLVAIVSFVYTRAPFRWFSIVLGSFSIAVLLLYISGIYLGIGRGGMERMIAYPVIIWTACYGGYLSAGTSDFSLFNKNN